MLSHENSQGWPGWQDKFTLCLLEARSHNWQFNFTYIAWQASNERLWAGITRIQGEVAAPAPSSAALLFQGPVGKQRRDIKPMGS